MRSLPALLLFLVPLFAFAQADTSSQAEKSMDIVGQAIPADAKAFFVTEIGGFEHSGDFEAKLMRYLLERQHVKDVVYEMGHAYAFLLNEFMRDETAYRQRYGSWPQKDCFFQAMKTLYQDHHFTIHGIDFEGLEFVVAVHGIMQKSPGARNTDLYKYIESVTDTVEKVKDGEDGRSVRVEIYEKAKQLFNEEQYMLMSLLPQEEPLLDEIFNNHVQEKRLVTRNTSMLRNLGGIPNLGAKSFICLLSASQNGVDKRYSVLRNCLKQHPENTVVIDMICKNCEMYSYNNETIHQDMTKSKDTKHILPQLIAAYDTFYNSSHYTLVEQHSIKGLEEYYNDQPTYYALFKNEGVTK